MDFDDLVPVSRKPDEDEKRLINPYMDVAGQSRPPEIVNFELETDPYRNFLPGISSVNAAKTVGRGLRAGRGGNRVMLIVSLLLVAVLVLPAFAAVIAQLLH
jgi:hypothetical protein